MARSGVTREQVFETADALVREGQNPTVVAVRTRLGGGSPNTITPLLAEWKTLNETKQAAAMPQVPECVFRPKLDTDSGPKWTAIPAETGQ